MEAYHTALESDRSSLHEGCRHLPACLLHDSAEGGTGDIHAAGSFLLTQTLQVGKPQRL
jgi:hypothetical protein